MAASMWLLVCQQVLHSGADMADSQLSSLLLGLWSWAQGFSLPEFIELWIPSHFWEEMYAESCDLCLKPDIAI
jgi:hypothetical protein